MENLISGMSDDIPNRQSIRLPRYDYSRPGAYFITLCTQNRVPLFGKIVAGEMRLNDTGMMAENCWKQIPVHFPHVVLDSFVIMPDHVHGIVWITDETENKGEYYSPLRTQKPRTGKFPDGTSKTVGSIVRGFKTGITQWMRQNTDTDRPWQRGYHERIIRDENALQSIRRYIVENPVRWQIKHDHGVRRGE